MRCQACAICSRAMGFDSEAIRGYDVPIPETNAMRSKGNGYLSVEGTSREIDLSCQLMLVSSWHE